MEHYHAERHHQELGGKLIRPEIANDNVNRNGQIECRERLGGILKFYCATGSVIAQFEFADATGACSSSSSRSELRLLAQHACLVFTLLPPDQPPIREVVLRAETCHRQQCSDQTELDVTPPSVRTGPGHALCLLLGMTNHSGGEPCTLNNHNPSAESPRES